MSIYLPRYFCNLNRFVDASSVPSFKLDLPKKGKLLVKEEEYLYWARDYIAKGSYFEVLRPAEVVGIALQNDEVSSPDVKLSNMRLEIYASQFIFCDGADGISKTIQHQLCSPATATEKSILVDQLFEMDERRIQPGLLQTTIGYPLMLDDYKQHPHLRRLLKGATFIKKNGRTINDITIVPILLKRCLFFGKVDSTAL
uniref:Uncharacterized protein n=1 Tax=Ditylenchus dipsaci TaxID=166011 RepID=A0A915EVZ7_9BILA